MEGEEGLLGAWKSRVQGLSAVRTTELKATAVRLPPRVWWGNYKRRCWRRQQLGEVPLSKVFGERWLLLMVQATIRNFLQTNETKYTAFRDHVNFVTIDNKSSSSQIPQSFFSVSNMCASHSRSSLHLLTLFPFIHQQPSFPTIMAGGKYRSLVSSDTGGSLCNGRMVLIRS